MRGLFADDLLPMSAPAALYRCACAGADLCADDAHVPVARGPLIIMVHGLLALPEARRGEFRITSDVGDLDAVAAAEAIRYWSHPPKREH